jgi:cell division protein FtsN
MTSRSPSSRPVAANARPRARRKGALGGTLIGLFVGVIVGLAIAAGAAWYLMKSGNPYQPSTAKESPREGAREPARSAKAEPATPDKPPFDFYKILPGAEEAKPQPKAAEKSADRATLERAKEPTREPSGRDAPAKEPDKAIARADERATSRPTEPVPPAAKPGERFWLQAGSFAGEADAENLRARLALAGWEAAVQKADIPDKGTRYRVRLGPYDNTDELSRTRAELGKRGFDVAVIRQ